MIKVSNVKLYSTKDLMARLKSVTMLTDKSRRPYEKASISIPSIATNELSPPQRYALQGEFEKVRDLRWALLAYKGQDMPDNERTQLGWRVWTQLGLPGIDILQMTKTKIVLVDGRPHGVPVAPDRANAVPCGYVEFDVETESGPQTITVLPPVIERQREEDGIVYNVICDGLHRTFLARACSIKPTVVVIDGVPPDMPYYAHPLPDGWRDVQLMSHIPDDFIKKFHRVPHPDYKNLYRDFNSAFTNVGGPRGGGKQIGH